MSPLSAFILRFGLVCAALSPAIGQGQELKRIAYPITADKVQELALLKALGQVPAGKSEEDFGRKNEIRVSNSIVVTDVPVDFLKASADAALAQTAALGFLPVKEGESLEKLINDRKLDGKVAAKALVQWWTVEIMTELNPDNGELSAQDLLTRDMGRAKGLQSLGAAPSETLQAQWLLFPSGMDQFSPIRQVRKPVTLRTLIERFDPATTASENNAVATAEDLVWTWRIGLGDGKAATLSDSRSVIQAHLVERLGFKVGDPLDSNEAQRKAARENLASALKTCQTIWRSKGP